MGVIEWGTLAISVSALGLSAWNTWRAEGRPARDRQRQRRAEVREPVEDLLLHLQGRPPGYDPWVNIRRLESITALIRDKYLRRDLTRLHGLYVEHAVAWDEWEAAARAEEAADAAAEDWPLLRQLRQDRDAKVATLQAVSDRIRTLHPVVLERLNTLESRHG